ncbi:MAG: hypothetical protein QWI36_04060 [Wolbachia endosymbiont of Tyrophagus putrescentiae]|nr:hypothetical protein [Wolbachia endosymbiont of Tyrophagus putrescentiae]
MSLITKGRKQRYITSTAIGFFTSAMVFTLSIPAAAALGAYFLNLTKLGNAIPEWMQFIKISGLEHMTPQINGLFYMGLILAAITTTATIYMLCKMHNSSKGVGKSECKSEIFIVEENQQITISENGSTDVCVTLLKEYPRGCIIASKSERKTITLKLVKEEEDGRYKYEVVDYQNTANPQIEKKEFSKDFFYQNTSVRNDVTIYSTTPSKLADVLTAPLNRTSTLNK